MTSVPSSDRTPIVWRNIIVLALYHIIGFQGIYYVITGTLRWQTFVFDYLLGHIAAQGTTSGVHRLWCHRTYKARFPLRVFLCLLQTITFQQSIYDWSRDHRVHHKFSETNADPHNSTRGFFFAHMGWLMVRKHPDVTKMGETVDMSDLEKDPVVRFQKKYFAFLAITCGLVLPTLIPWYCWNEDLYVAFAGGMYRHLVNLHMTWLVNSAAHMWGMKPYDRNIKPSENPIVSWYTQGEGWHNYHHVFPWDYKAAELGNYGLNWSTAFIDFMAKIGLAYNLKSASQHMIKSRIERTGMM